MTKQTLIEELKERGYFEQATFEDELEELLENEKVTFYIGFDATADSLTIGHFIQIMVMKRMQMRGHRPIALLGGGTTLIGDPSGRTDMRSMMTRETINHNAERFAEQISRFIDFSSEDKGIIENNANWLLDLNFLDFMRDIGTEFNVNQMLNLDAYKNRLEEGLTFFEMSYMLLQSYDYLHLYRKYGAKLQVGGSDQWSNILGGYDLVKKREDDKVYAMTFALLTTAEGVKMGKSMKGAIWLDIDKTPAYDLFQYMRNVDDRDVEKFLLQLTFIPTEECKELGRLDGDINHGKEVLAYEVTKMVHGVEAVSYTHLRALEAAKALFEGGVSSENMNTEEIEGAKFEEGYGLLNLLKDIGLTNSNSEARNLIKGGGLSLNGSVVEDPRLTVTMDNFENDELIIKKGKKTYLRVICK